METSSLQLAILWLELATAYQESDGLQAFTGFMPLGDLLENGALQAMRGSRERLTLESHVPH
eukprot:5012002-Amphidinium_carterae.1